MIGDRLKALREVRGWSQSELARRAQVHRPTISELEAGKQVDVGVAIAKRLARALGVSLAMLVGEADESTREPALASITA